MDLENEYDDDNLLPHITVDDDPRPQVVPQNGLLGSSSLISATFVECCFAKFYYSRWLNNVFFFSLQHE